MNDPPGARPERRRHVRICPKGTSILHVESRALRGRIANLGEGGMFMITGPAASAQLLGKVVDLEMRLDGNRAQWLRTSARIVRITDDGVAVAFAAPPGALRRVIDDLVTASLARTRVLAVVLIDAEAQRRSAIVAGFRAAGCSVIEAATPLEAIVRLGESSFEPDVIAIADSYPVESAEEMRGFVHSNHPQVKLVTIGDALLEPDGIVHWLSSADPESDLPARVRQILVRPRP